MNTFFGSVRRVAAVSVVGLMALVTGALAACGGDDGPSASEPVQVTGGWARNSPMMATTGAAYMVISSTTGDRLLAASVDASIAGSVEVHEVVPADGEPSDTGHSGMNHSGTDHSGMNHSGTEQSGMNQSGSSMIMREVPYIEIPAGQSVTLKPGGYHVMLLGLVAPLEIGQVFDVRLSFATAGDIVVPVEVRDEAP